jgi:polysaccharide pyruvyl transferase WcaK-like protein
LAIDFAHIGGIFMYADRNKPMRIALFGQFGTGNHGNDASLLAAVAALRAHDPDVDILCLCYDPESVTQRYGLRATTIRGPWAKRGAGRSPKLLRGFRRVSDLIRMYRLARKLDVVMVPGSGLFEAGRHGPGSVASLLFSTALAARLAGTPFMVVSVGVDAAERRSTRALLRWTLRLSTYRSYRDDHSRRSAVGFGARCESDPVYPDLAFGLEAPAQQRVARNQNESVGVGVIAYHGPFSYDSPAKREPVAAAYLSALTSFVEWLLDRGLRVTLFGGDGKDEKVAEDVRERVLHGTPNALIDIAHSDSLDDVFAHMQQFDYVVATRYHNIVAAAMTGTPVISINYRAKNGEVLNEMGVGKFHQPLHHLDGERLREQFLDLQQSTDEVARRMVAASRTYRDRVELQWSTLMTTVMPQAGVGELTQRRRG